MSLRLLGKPKNACHIQVSYDAAWDNYLLTNDRLTRGKYNAKVSQRLTPIQNGLMVRVRW